MYTYFVAFQPHKEERNLISTRDISFKRLKPFISKPEMKKNKKKTTKSG